MERGGSRESDTLLEASEGKDMGEPAANASTLKKFHHPNIFSGLVCESCFATSGNRLDLFLDRAYR